MPTSLLVYEIDFRPKTSPRRTASVLCTALEDVESGAATRSSTSRRAPGARASTPTQRREEPYKAPSQERGVADRDGVSAPRAPASGGLWTTCWCAAISPRSGPRLFEPAGKSRASAARQRAARRGSTPPVPLEGQVLLAAVRLLGRGHAAPAIWREDPQGHTLCTARVRHHRAALRSRWGSGTIG